MPGRQTRRLNIFTSSAFMKEAASWLLKVLEELPAHASIFLLAENTCVSAADHPLARRYRAPGRLAA